MHHSDFMYLEVMDWQLAHIKEGLRQAEAGEFATDEEVKAAFDLWKEQMLTPKYTKQAIRNVRQANCCDIVATISPSN